MSSKERKKSGGAAPKSPKKGQKIDVASHPSKEGNAKKKQGAKKGSERPSSKSGRRETGSNRSGGPRDAGSSRHGGGRDTGSRSGGPKGVATKGDKGGKGRKGPVVTPQAPTQPAKRRKKKKRSAFQRFKDWILYGGSEIELPEGPARTAVDALNLGQADLQILKRSFDSVDIDGSNEIDYNEFFELVEEPRSPYSDALFALIDVDGSGTIDFGEFIQVLTTYCMFTKEDILTFCFETFDKDGSGAIDEKEFMELCRTVNNANPMFPGNFTRALEEFDRNADGLIDFDEFRELNKRYPLILFPAFRMQDRMQKATLGEKRWLKRQVYMEKKRQLEEYRLTHEGELPPLSFCEKVWEKLTGHNKYEILETDANLNQVQEMKKQALTKQKTDKQLKV